MTQILKLTRQSTNDAIKANLAAISEDETILVIEGIAKERKLLTALNNVPAHINTLDLSRALFVTTDFYRNILAYIPSHITTLNLSNMPQLQESLFRSKLDSAYSLIPAGVTHLIIKNSFIHRPNGSLIVLNSVEIAKAFRSIPDTVKEVTLSHRDVCSFKVEDQIALARSLPYVLKINIVDENDRPIKPERICCGTSMSVTPGLFKENIGNSLVEANNQLMDLRGRSGSSILPSDIALEVLSFLTVQPYEAKELAEEQGQIQQEKQQQKQREEQCKFFAKGLGYAAGVVAGAATLYALV